MSHEVDEQYAVYDETYPKARKEHKCDACDQAIRIGDRYARVGIVDQGKGESLKRCLRCQAIHEHLRALGYGDAWPAERLNCGLKYEDEWGPVPDEIAALAFALPGDLQPTRPT